MDHTTCWAIIMALAGFSVTCLTMWRKSVNSHMRDLREINGMSGGKHGHKE